jgi:hypothetical protein
VVFTSSTSTVMPGFALGGVHCTVSSSSVTTLVAWAPPNSTVFGPEPVKPRPLSVTTFCPRAGPLGGSSRVSVGASLP